MGQRWAGSIGGVPHRRIICSSRSARSPSRDLQRARFGTHQRHCRRYCAGGDQGFRMGRERSLAHALGRRRSVGSRGWTVCSHPICSVADTLFMKRPNHALHLTRRARRGCNSRVPNAGSLSSLGRTIRTRRYARIYSATRPAN
jgi:hypothetical protein